MITSNAAKLAKLLRESNKQHRNEFKVSDHLFAEQLAFVSDPSPTKVAVCSRRAGKTISCAADLVDNAIRNDNVVCLYITLSRNNAKKIIWKELIALNRQYELQGKFNSSELSITFPNGSMIYLSGAKDANEIEKFRGLALKIVYIDECQSFRAYLKDLIDDILAPALLDHAGTLCLIGTPGPVPVGYFYDCSVKSNTWSKHSWTFWNNPFLIKKSKLTHHELLDREIKRRGVELTDPSIQREFFGKWESDTNSLLMRFNPEINHYEKLPDLKYTYILGIDLGFNDADALAVLAWSEETNTTYLIEETVVNKQGLTELVDQIKFLEKKYNLSKLVIDEGGLGKKLAEEMRRRHAIPVHGADKTRKMENIELLNDAMRTGKFKAKKDSRYAQDCYLVEIDKDKSTPDKIKVSNKYHSDIIDAVLYAFKESMAFTYQAQAKKPQWGTPEWAKAEEDEMFEHELESFQRQQELQKMGNGWNND